MGEVPESSRQQKLRPLTFNQVAASLKEVWDKRVKRGDMKQKTHQEYIYRLNNLCEYFGNTVMMELKEADLEKYRDDRIYEYSVITANKDLQIIKAVIRQGFEMNVLKEDPARNLKKLSEKKHERKRFLLPEELDLLLRCASKKGGRKYLPAIILLGAEHGASRQECLNLKWEDIKLNYGKLGLIHFYRDKTELERTDWLMPRTRKAILDWWNHLEYIRKKKKVRVKRNDYVFCLMDGTPIERFDAAFKSAVKEAGFKDFHFHDLRHTFCSNLILSGVGIKEVKEMIGHRDISMTDRYSHLPMQYKETLQRQLEKQYEKTEFEDAW